jgi:methyltransferase-like protein
MSQANNLKNYELVPYVNKPHPQSHPDRLATVATLFGLKPPAIDRCRVLELGCALGGNIIPMAVGLPESRFVGIDHSPRQIAEGQKIVAAVGLTNIELRAASILGVDDSYGQFDYIISHGVYSWVPAGVRDKLLEIYRRNLAPEGIGYVSYNTLPGWHTRGMIRDMMLYHTGRLGETAPRNQINQARALLDFIAQSVPADQDLYGSLLRQELSLLKNKADGYFFHDHLEIDNDAFYFFQFERHLRSKELRYLGEANVSEMRPSGFPPEVRGVLAKLAPTQIELEQYLDFLRNRTFRQTLVCHGRQRPTYTLNPETITRCHVASAYRPVAAQPDFGENTAAEFVGPAGEKTATREPIVKAAMCCLAEAWPQALPFETLCQQARTRLGSAADPQLASRDTLTLGSAFLSAYAGTSSGMIELRSRPLPVAGRVSDRPTASPLVRWQAVQGEEGRVTNLRHERLSVSEPARKLLPLLDGSRDRDALLDELIQYFRTGELQLALEGNPVTEEPKARLLLAKELEQQLLAAARAALLVA